MRKIKMNISSSKVRILENAILVPSMRNNSGLGVFEQSGEFVEESQIFRENESLFAIPHQRHLENITEKLEGTHLYGGILSRHFGHFIVESLSRLWAAPYFNEHPCNILFFPKGRADIERKDMKFQKEWIALLCPNATFQEIKQPTIVERLIIPQQGFGTAGLEKGIPEFREFIKNVAMPQPKGDEPKNIYVSRDGLREDVKGKILESKSLATHLEAYNYITFHPQKHSLEEQLRIYQAADRLIFEEGSALHVFGLVAQESQFAVVILRRFMQDYTKVVGRQQLKYFAHIDLKIIDAVSREWRREGLPEGSSKSHGELDKAALFTGLKGLRLVEYTHNIDDFIFPSEEKFLKPMREQNYVARERPLKLHAPFTVAHYHDIRIPDNRYFTVKTLKTIREGFYERQKIKNACAIIEKNDRVFELRAAFGITSAIIAKTCQPEAVLAFERNPAFIEPIKDIIRVNGLEESITVRNETIIDKDHAVYNAPLTPFKDVIQSFQPTVLIIDIEGAELDLLHNENISSLRAIIIKLHRTILGREGMKACRTALKEAGFTQNLEYSKRGIESWVK